MSEKSISFGRRMAEMPIHIEALDTLFYFEFSDKFKDYMQSFPAWEMIYADHGHCRIFSDDKTFMLEQGELYFHKPYEEHMLEVLPGEYPNILVCSFRSSSPALSHLIDRKIRVSAPIKGHIAAIIDEATRTFDLSNRRLVIQGILFRNENRLFGGEQSIFLRLTLMLIEILREHVFNDTLRDRFLTKEAAADSLCCKIIDYLQQHLYEKLYIPELCAHFSFSRSRVCGHFSKVCGMPITRYFNLMKMEEAKHLIRTTSLSFFEISERLMLANSHYFSTLFKDVVGMTPSQYKKSCK